MLSFADLPRSRQLRLAFTALSKYEKCTIKPGSGIPWNIFQAIIQMFIERAPYLNAPHAKYYKKRPISIYRRTIIPVSPMTLAVKPIHVIYPNNYFNIYRLVKHSIRPQTVAFKKKMTHGGKTQCNHCHKLFPHYFVQVDHIKSLYISFHKGLTRYMAANPHQSNASDEHIANAIRSEFAREHTKIPLQPLCIPCHEKKTIIDNILISRYIDSQSK